MAKDNLQSRAGSARHNTSVDQSDRRVPINLRQSGPTPVEMLISTRVRKSPYWHLSVEAGCWRATVYNRIIHKAISAQKMTAPWWNIVLLLIRSPCGMLR